MRLRLSIILACTIPFAGCATEAPGGDLDDDDFSRQIAMSRMRLNSCTGSGARLEAPEQTLVAPVPPGWDGKNGLPTTVTLFTLLCEHLSLGSFERGPVQLVIESHEKFSAPMNCREGEYDFLNILTRVVWSDPEIAAAVQAELGIPTSVGTIEMTTAGEELAGVTTFRWTIDGRESSYDIGYFQNRMQEPKVTYRYVWPDAANQRLGLIDLNLDSIQTQFEPTAMQGAFSEPMILASAGMPFYGGVGALSEFMPTGEFRFFEGYECATPTPLAS